MTLRERILAVYRGQTPDVVPYMLDLSHWFYHRHQLPWDVSSVYTEPEYRLIDYHKTVGAGFYNAINSAFVETVTPDDVTARTSRSRDGREITWQLETPLGRIQRKRLWHEETYAWGISHWGVRSEQDLRILGYALGAQEFEPRWERYKAWDDYVGDDGIVYLSHGYSAMGYLLNYWMGIEATVYAAADWPDTLHEVVDRINAARLRKVKLLCESPAEVIIVGDNFSGDVQPPRFFEKWSRPHYVQAIDMIHAAGKHVAVHIDGKLRGALEMFAAIGADCADAVTPVPMGDLEPAQCRAEAGADMILSGGVSPDLWYPTVEREAFEAAVRRWLSLKKDSPRLIAGAGDQVPPGAAEDRILLMRDLVEEHGGYA